MQPQDWLEIGTAFVAGSGATEVIRWLLGLRTRKIQDTSILTESWSKLTQEIQEERNQLKAQVVSLTAWQEEAKKELASLRTETALLRTQVQGMNQRICCLENENCVLSEENEALRLENEQLRGQDAGQDA